MVEHNTAHIHPFTLTLRRLMPALGLLTALVALALSSGCSTSSYRPSALRPFETDPAFEINDSDIAQAYAARPQMPEAARVAFFSYDPGHMDAVEQTLKETEGVASVYRIPAFLVTGEHRYDEGQPAWARPAPQPLSLKKLRVLAARAHADVLVVVDYGYRQEVSPNGLVALNVLLIPTLFSPFLDVKVESFMDTYVLDVRNGYLYGHVGTQESGEERWVSIYDTDEHPLVGQQLPLLLASTRAALGEVIQKSREETAAGMAGGAVPELNATPADPAP